MPTALMDNPLKKTLPLIDTAKKYISKIVLQPTTLCNLNCSYCYLADRKLNHSMPVEIAQAIANDFKKVLKHQLLLFGTAANR